MILEIIIINISVVSDANFLIPVKLNLIHIFLAKIIYVGIVEFEFWIWRYLNGFILLDDPVYVYVSVWIQRWRKVCWYRLFDALTWY